MKCDMLPVAWQLHQIPEEMFDRQYPVLPQAGKINTETLAMRSAVPSMGVNKIRVQKIRRVTLYFSLSFILIFAIVKLIQPEKLGYITNKLDRPRTAVNFSTRNFKQKKK